jgi:predicted MFS family arabinose efflux permease
VSLPLAIPLALVVVRGADEWFGFLPIGVIESVRADLGLTYADVGLILAAPAASGLLGHGLWIAADYVDRRLMSTVGAVFYGLCLLLIASAHSLGLVLAGAFLWGIASDGMIAGCELTLIQLSGPRLTANLGWVNAFAAVGDLLGPLSVAFATGLGGDWRQILVTGGSGTLLYGLLLSRQSFPPRQPTPPDAAKPLDAIRAVLAARHVLLLGLVAGLFSLLDEPFLGFLIVYLQQVQGLAAAAALAVVAIAVGSGIIGSIAVSWFSGRLSATRLLWTFGVLIAGSVGLLVFSPLVAGLLVGAFVFGLSGAIFYSVLQAAYFSRRPDQAGVVRAVISTVGWVGIGFPALVGAVADSHGLTLGLSLYAAVPIAFLVLLVPATGDARRRYPEPLV